MDWKRILNENNNNKNFNDNNNNQMKYIQIHTLPILNPTQP